MSPPTRYRRPSDAACEVLARALDVILRDPTSWNQDVYGLRRPSPTRHENDDTSSSSSCGTAFCVAGHVTVTVLGYRPIWSTSFDGSATLSSVDVPGRGHVSVDVAAADALELTRRHPFPEVAELVPDRRADRLFRAATSLRRLLDLAFLYTDGRVDRLAAYDHVVREHVDVYDRDRYTERSEREVLIDRVTFTTIDRLDPAKVDQRFWEDVLS